MSRAIGSVALICGLILLLLCGMAYAQEQPTPTQSGEEPIPMGEDQLPPAQEGGEATPGSVYFYLEGELSPVDRDVTGGAQMAEFGVNDLLEGPTEEEVAAGYITYIPEGVKLQYSTVKMDNSEYGVNLSRELMELQGDKESSIRALAQIVKTLQELTGIETIGITVAAEGTGSDTEDAFTALGVTQKEVENEIKGIKESGNTGLIIAIVLIVLFVALLIFLIFYISKKRKSAESKPASSKKKGKKRARK